MQRDENEAPQTRSENVTLKNTEYSFLTHRYVLHPPELWPTTSEKKVSVWWFPADFTQTHINGRHEPNGKKGSNACTIICILTAIRLHEGGLHLIPVEGIPLAPEFVSLFAACIGEGNAIHERLFRSGELSHMNLTVPEALTACSGKGTELTEWFYVQKSLSNILALPQSLFENMHQSIREWSIHPPPKASSDLYLILIADARSVLICYQRNTGKLTLIDSHSHLHSGAVVAQTDELHIKELCHWYGNICSEIFATSPDCYELSLLFFKRQRYGSRLMAPL